MYYANLNLTKIKDNNRFWKTLKPSLTDKGINTPEITLIENQLIVNADVEVAETLNSFSSDATKSLHINENRYILNDTLDLTDPIDIALKMFESHPIILIIKVKVSASPLNTVTLEDLKSEIRNLNPNNASTVNSIPIRNFKENFDICGPTLYPIVNNAILDCMFPEKLKLADISPLHKKDDKTDKKNYRPISILCKLKWCILLIQNDIHTCAGIEKDTIHSMH